MAEIKEILTQMKRNPKDVRFSDLCKVCDFSGKVIPGLTYKIIKERPKHTK